VSTDAITEPFTCLILRSKKLISKLLAPYKEDLIAKDINLLDGTVLSIISKAKAKGCRPDELLPQSTGVIRNENASGTNATTPQGDIANIVSKIYSDYEKSLRQSNSLDFDDLLLFGVKLFSQHKQAVQWCKHVLVDEL
jgi:DNA helicase II / ATP-dependent DNA helicase PcrA